MSCVTPAATGSMITDSLADDPEAAWESRKVQKICRGMLMFDTETCQEPPNGPFFYRDKVDVEDALGRGHKRKVDDMRGRPEAPAGLERRHQFLLSIVGSRYCFPCLAWKSMETRPFLNQTCSVGRMVVA